MVAVNHSKRRGLIIIMDREVSLRQHQIIMDVLTNRTKMNIAMKNMEVNTAICHRLLVAYA